MEHGLSFYFQRHWCVSIGIVHLKPKCRGRRCRGRQCNRSCHYPPPPPHPHPPPLHLNLRILRILILLLIIIIIIRATTTSLYNTAYFCVLSGVLVHHPRFSVLPRYPINVYDTDVVFYW